ncbi:MAG: ethanolamine utilization protein [Zoogloea sp.]|nr:ethanolamine utilization protein [Zoogloea sp.]
MFAPRLAFIDVETTGANPVVDRITEIAVLRVEDGELVERWSSLVNPGIPIPGNIQSLVGITDEMVADAPAFAELAGPIRRLLADCIFVAHNARFDYGFIKNEFQRIGEGFDAPVLCTVKLSRALYPQHHKHGLDALIERHGLTCSARHRAMGDTEALYQFAGIVAATFERNVLDMAIVKAMKAPSRPAGLPEGVLEGIPEGPGVYVFHGENDLPIYVGRSLSLRSRVMSHFSSDHRSGKEAKIARNVRRVDWQVTAGELGALMLESRLLGQLKPAENRQPRDAEAVFGLRRLCPRRLGTEPWSEGPCLAHLAKRCAGVCAGKESPAEHDERLLKVLESLRLKRWPWGGPVTVREAHPETGRLAFHLLDGWCVLGTVEDESALAALIAEPPARAFDLDTYRILLRWLDTPTGKASVSVVSGAPA